MTKVIGVDAAAGSWLGLVLIDGRFAGAELRSTVAELLERHADASVVAVDIPIGLPSRQYRPADFAARQFVGNKRVQSIFLTPPEEVLRAGSYSDARARAQAILGKGITAQSYSLRERIFEVGKIVATSHRRVIEVHPEVSFRQLKGRELAYSKHSWNGVNERRALLAGTGILLPDDVPDAGPSAPDDVVDAAVAAWSAFRFATGHSETLPAVAPTDPDLGGVIHY